MPTADLTLLLHIPRQTSLCQFSFFLADMEHLHHKWDGIVLFELSSSTEGTNERHDSRFFILALSSASIPHGEGRTNAAE